MSKVKFCRSHEPGDALMFVCPGCNERHVVPVKGPSTAVWSWNGSLESPTFSPSVLIRSGHCLPEHKGDCWCDYNAKHPDEPASYKCGVCHSFVRDGKIEFLSDCTHALAGQTVELPEQANPP